MNDETPSHQDSHPIVLATKDPTALETGLRLEVERLTQDVWRPSSRPVDLPQIAGRPVWWWDVRLIEWAWSNRAGHDHHAADLRLLRDRLRSMERDEMAELIRDLLREDEEEGGMG